MSKGIHRVTADSKRGRQMAGAKGAVDGRANPGTPEQQKWNAQVEAERRAKKESRWAKRAEEKKI